MLKQFEQENDNTNIDILIQENKEDEDDFDTQFAKLMDEKRELMQQQEKFHAQFNRDQTPFSQYNRLDKFLEQELRSDLSDLRVNEDIQTPDLAYSQANQYESEQSSPQKQIDLKLDSLINNQY